MSFRNDGPERLSVLAPIAHRHWDLVEEVCRRARVGGEGLAALASSDCDFVLRVVAYVSEGDQFSPGFALSKDVVSLLANVGAFVDIDLYVVD